MILMLLFAFTSCILSSYLDIPPPPKRPIRFQTKEQIENYLKSVKDYYDAFKIKLVRREDGISNLYSNEELNDDEIYLFKKLYQIYQENQPSRKSLRQRLENNLI